MDAVARIRVDAKTKKDAQTTIGFQELGGLTGKSPKSLIRMFGPAGNPQARNLFAIIDCLRKREGLRLKVQAVHRPKSRNAAEGRA